METYLDRIKRVKNEQKLTNDQLAERSGIPLGTLSKILAGMSDSPKLSNMIALCGALGCSMEYIVNGTPENNNNYMLEASEIELIERYRLLDRWGKAMVETVVAKECERVAETSAPAESAPVEKPKTERRAKILEAPARVNRYAGEPLARTGKRQLPLYELPVSAGVGEYVDENLEKAEIGMIRVPHNDKTAEASFALRISGNSMEPKYRNGDVLLVQSTDTIESGELGIFLLDGAGYFKIYDGDRLQSINPDYGPILLKEYSNVQCKGRVIGKLKRK